MDRRVAVLVYLVLLTALLGVTFAPHLAGNWVWDDVYLVQENPNVHGGLSGLRVLLSHDLWGSAGRRSSELYHPVPMALMWLISRGGGGGGSVVPFRAVNVVLHAGCVLVFAAWLRRRRVPASGARFASLVFAMHPLVAEPVMWITGCHDTLATLGCLTALSVWPRTDDAHVARRIAAASFLTVWAALCKEPYFVLPVILGLVAAVGDGEAPGRVGRDAWLRRIASIGGPMIGLGSVIVLRHQLGIPTGSARLHATPSVLLVDYATVVLHYLRRGLTFDGGLTAEAYRPIGQGSAVLVLVLLAGITLLLLVRLRGRALGADMAAIGWGWFLVALAPHAVATPSIGMFGNRYAYFPTMGLATALVGLGLPVAARVPGPLLGVLRWLAPLAAVALVPFTALRARLWHDELALFGADLETNPDDSRALYHYGHAVRMESGCAAALPFFVRSAENEPGFPRAWHNVAGCLVDLRRYREALSPAQVAYRLQPDDAGAAFNLAVARLGTGDTRGGRSLLAEAVRLDPRHSGAQELLTRVSGTGGNASP